MLIKCWPDGNVYKKQQGALGETQKCGDDHISFVRQNNYDIDQDATIMRQNKKENGKQSDSWWVQLSDGCWLFLPEEVLKLNATKNWRSTVNTANWARFNKQN